MDRSSELRAARHALIVGDLPTVARHLEALFANAPALTTPELAQAYVLQSKHESEHFSFESAATAIDKAAPLIADPDFPDPLMRALVNLVLSGRHWRAGDDRTATVHAELAWDDLPESLPLDRSDEALFVFLVAASDPTDLGDPERPPRVIQRAFDGLDALERAGAGAATDPTLTTYRASFHMRAGYGHTEHGRHDEALKSFRTALRIRRAHLGPDHFHTAYAMQSVAGTQLQDKDDPDPEATQRLLERAHAIIQKTFPPEYPLVSSSFSLLALNDLVRGRVGTALERLRLASALTDERPSFDPGAGSMRLLLARLLRQYDAPQAALAVIAPTVEGLLPFARTSSRVLERALVLQCSLLRALGRHAESVPIGEAVIARWAGDPEVGPRLVAIATNAIAEVAHREGDLERAERLLRRALAIAEVSFDEVEHLEALYRNLIEVLKDSGRKAEAQTLTRKIMALKKPRRPPT